VSQASPARKYPASFGPEKDDQVATALRGNWNRISTRDSGDKNEVALVVQNQEMVP
jgi:hypothetical protein